MIRRLINLATARPHKPTLAEIVAAQKAANAAWAKNRAAQLSPERRIRIATIIGTGFRP